MVFNLVEALRERLSDESSSDAHAVDQPPCRDETSSPASASARTARDPRVNTRVDPAAADPEPDDYGETYGDFASREDDDWEEVALAAAAEAVAAGMNAAPRGLPRVSSSRLRARSSRRVVGGGSSPATLVERRIDGDDDDDATEGSGMGVRRDRDGRGWASPRARVSRRRPARETREVDARRRTRGRRFAAAENPNRPRRDRIRRRARRPSPSRTTTRRRRRRAAPRAIGFAPSLQRDCITRRPRISSTRSCAGFPSWAPRFAHSVTGTRSCPATTIRTRARKTTVTYRSPSVGATETRRPTASPRVGDRRASRCFTCWWVIFSVFCATRGVRFRTRFRRSPRSFARAAPFHVGFAKCSYIARDTSSARFAARTTPTRAPPRPRPIAIPRRGGRCKNFGM